MLLHTCGGNLFMHKKHFFEKKMNNILILNIEKKYQMTARNLPGCENYMGQIGARIPMRIKCTPV